MLFQRHHSRLCAVARRILGSGADAEDAVQNAYVRALTRFHQFAGRSDFVSWLTRIVINEALTHLRSRARFSSAAEVSTAGEGAGLVAVSHARDPEAQAASRELRILIWSVLDSLPGKYRAVLELREIHAMDISETAQLLGVSCNCVKVRTHRARALFRTRLERRLKTGARHPVSRERPHPARLPVAA